MLMTTSLKQDLEDKYERVIRLADSCNDAITNFADKVSSSLHDHVCLLKF